MKIKIALFLLFVVFSCFSCQYSEPTIHHLFNSYFVPNKAKVRTEDSKHFYIKFYGEEIKEGSTQFTSLSKEFGDTGENRPLTLPPYPKPYNITGLRIIQSVNGETKDVSAEFIISYTDYSRYVASKYSIGIAPPVKKRVNEMTEHDLKWLFSEFYLQSLIKDDTKLSLIVDLKDAKALTVEL